MKVKNEVIDKTKALDITAFFFVYAITGWLIETFYRSFSALHFINPGFFNGPYLPIYGFSALIILTIHHVMDYNVFYTVILGTLLITLLEYITGSIAQTYMGVQLWDYTDQKYHINGLVSLRFTIYWAVLLLMFLKVLHPIMNTLIMSMTHQQKVWFCSMMLALVFYDTLSASALYTNLKSSVGTLRTPSLRLRNRLSFGAPGLPVLPALAA